MRPVFLMDVVGQMHMITPQTTAAKHRVSIDEIRAHYQSTWLLIRSRSDPQQRRKIAIPSYIRYYNDH